MNETILGIPVRYNDIETKYLRFEKRREQPQPVEHLRQDHYHLITNLELAWKEQIITEEYYSSFDIVSEIGGIRGSVIMTFKGTAFIFVIHYIWTLAKLI